MVTQSPRKFRVRWFRWLLRLLVLLILVVGWGLLQGIPGTWVSSFLHQNQNVPGLLELGDVVWRPGHGWSVDQVTWYSPRDLTRPLIHAENVTWQPGLKEASSRVRVAQASLTTELGMWTGRLGLQQPLLVEDVEGEILWDDSHFSLQGIQFLVSGIQVQIEGEVDREPRTSLPSREVEFPLVQRLSRSLIPIIRGLEAYSSTTVPILWVEVSGSQANPQLTFQLNQSEEFILRGNTFSSFQAKGLLENRVLTLSDVKVMASETESLTAEAEVDFRERMFDLQLDNTLNREALEALSPFSLDGLLSNIEVRVEGQATFSLHVGPVSFEKPGERVNGTFTVQDASYRDAFFSSATFELDWKAPHLQIPTFSGTTGTGETAGKVGGSLELHGGTGLFRLNVEGTADPAQAVSLVGPEVESLIREWEFKSKPPEFKLDVDQPRSSEPLKLSLMARAEDAVWRGTLFHHVRAVTTLDEEGLRIRDVTATRAGHLLEGSFQFPSDLSSCTFTVTSNFPLPDMLPLLGQRAVDVVRSVRFLGPSRFSASGRADLSGDNDHDLSGEAVLEKVALNWAWFERLSSPFVLKGQTLDLPEIKGSTVGGSLEAELRLMEMFRSSGSFETNVTIRDVDLFDLVTRATDTTSTPYTGILDLDLILQGALSDTLDTRRAATFNGEGSIEIREGELFRIPLLLGLSSILSKVTKGFGYASQGDLDADFVIQDGQLSSKNVLVGGSVMSIAGTGGYHFTTREISGNVKVQLLKDGIMSDALKVLLWPIRKLIEVSLTGTLDNPDWRPRNLPKELFGK